MIITAISREAGASVKENSISMLKLFVSTRRMKRSPTKKTKLQAALLIALTLLFIAANYLQAQTTQPVQPPGPDPDARFKVDVLLVIAHPDDEGMIGSYL